MYLFLSVCLYIRQSIIPLSIRVSNYLSPLTLSMTASLHSLLFLSSPSFSQCALCQCICLCLSFCLSVFFSVCLRLQELSATDGFTSRLQQSFQHTHPIIVYVAFVRDMLFDRIAGSDRRLYPSPFPRPTRLPYTCPLAPSPKLRLYLRNT